jgi:hypothetical protein
VKPMLALALAVFMQGFLAMLQEPASAQEPETTVHTDNSRESATKLEPGTYYWTDGKWMPMQQITMSGGGTKHAAKMMVPGLTPQIVWTFREPHAPIQVKEAVPMFCVKFFAMPPGMPYAPSGRDIVIARFDEKKDHRELQITNGGNALTFKGGLGKDRTPEIKIDQVDASTYLVAPKATLATGEYILSTTAIAYNGYDFGFHPEK